MFSCRADIFSTPLRFIFGLHHIVPVFLLDKILRNVSLGCETRSLTSTCEGRAAQILHIGPYSEERPTIDRLHAFIEQQGWQASGKHHEIYLSTPGRTVPERLRTIIR